ncbi:MAG: FAD-binding protein [Sphaerochaeta sp.]
MLEKKSKIQVAGITIPVYFSPVLIIGSGAAALSCAVHLQRMGCDDLVIATDNAKGGTSRNTGSDKQTYYRLNDSSNLPDSPLSMATSYLQGGAMHGDIAFVESQGSLQAFYNLIALGVPFPHNKYGGFTGYKTDHDPSQRGISSGPFTSKVMVEKLEQELTKMHTQILDQEEAVRLILAEGNRVAGALFLNKGKTSSPSLGFSLILADHVVFGTGGPAGFYAASVYPRVHTGAIGLAMEVGAEAVNLTESQFGIASTKVRWNLSGSYQQVLPRYFSTDQQGNDEQDFLSPYFPSWEKITSAIFLKGYQWPFDASKISQNGSSLIDLLVYTETQVKNRRVFLDFRTNISGNVTWGPFGKKVLDETALGYLEKSNAWAETPIERLLLLNPDAYDLYLDKHIDLAKEAIEIDVCAQHNNGGLSADIWWESTNLRRFYPIGEVNGSHGVSRPGGSALNAGQVGALRCAQRIVGYGSEHALQVSLAQEEARIQIGPIVELALQWTKKAVDEHTSIKMAKDTLDAIRKSLQQRMSHSGGPVRSLHDLQDSYADAVQQNTQALQGLGIPAVFLPQALRLRHMLIAQTCYLFAIQEYLVAGGGSRGSFVVFDTTGGEAHPLLPDYRIKAENKDMRKVCQVISKSGEGTLQQNFVPCRALPDMDFWFEKVWADFRSRTYFTS